MAAMSVPSASAAQDASASSTAKLAIHNAVKAGWVHESVTALENGNSVTMANDVGTRAGHQVIDSNGAHAQVIVLNGNAYMYGDANAIANYFEITKTNPEGYANRWFVLTPANPNFAAVSGSVTLKSDFENFSIPKNAVLGETTVIDGQKVQAIVGHLSASSSQPAATITLYVTTTGKVLPVRYVVAGKGVHSTTDWSNWGKKVQLTTPKSTPAPN
jgi:hypothetical protein